MISKNELNAWAESLLVDKQYGIGVSSIYCDRKEDVPQGCYRTTIDDLDELDKMLICRILGEPIWDIDFKLWTLDSLKANGYDEFVSVEVATAELDIEPYLPQDFEVLAKLYPKGSLNPTDEYMSKENQWYKRVKQGFDEIEANVKPIDETDEEAIDKELEFMNSMFSKKDGTPVEVVRE